MYFNVLIIIVLYLGLIYTYYKNWKNSKVHLLEVNIGLLIITVLAFIVGLFGSLSKEQLTTINCINLIGIATSIITNIIMVIELKKEK